MRKYLSFLLLGVLCFQEIPIHQYPLEIKEEEASFGLEDREGRLRYEQLMTANPSTGLVPLKIRTRELDFAKVLDRNKPRGRTSALTINSVGPFNVGGRTRAVALDVRDENTIIAGGVSGGIWKSTDAGQSWIRTTEPELRNGVTALVQDTRPGREDTWYFGTGEIVGNSASGGSSPFRGSGIYKSVDNGNTWASIESTNDSEPNVFNSQFQYIWSIEINEKNLTEDEVLVAAYGGILRSLDGGENWVVEIGQELFNLDPEVDLNDINASFYTDLSKNSDGVFFATMSSITGTDELSPDAGIYLSENGSDWFEFSPIGEGQPYRRIVSGHSTTNESYFLVDSNPPVLLRFDLNRITPFGPTGGWTDLRDNVPMLGGQLGDFDSQNSFNMLVRVHPENDNIVFIGGTNLYRSTDGYRSDESIKWIGGYDPEGGTGVYLNHHPDQHNLIFYPSDPDKVLSANDGGLRLTSDVTADSVSWTSLNNGYLTSQFFTVALGQEANNDFVIGGMQDNGTDLSDGSANWEGVIGGDGGYAETTPDQTLWFASFQRGQTFRLTLNDDFNLTSFARVDPGGLVLANRAAYLFINPFLVDPTNPNRMFIAGGNQLYVNDNVSQIPGGSQEPARTGWFEVEDGEVRSQTITALDISLDGESLYYGTGTGSLRRITNAKDLIPEAEIVSTSTLPDGYISSISINPRNSEHFIICFSNYEIPSIFESVDGGISFQDISGTLEQFPDGTGNGPSVRWVELVPTNVGTLYLAGTSTGLYSTDQVSGTSTSWIRESPSGVGRSIATMMDYRPVDGRLAIATHGNGIFITTVPDFTPISVDRSGEQLADPIAAPNPSNDFVTINYQLPQDGVVRINLYTIEGELVRNLLWAPQFAGDNSITWDGANTSGTKVANGVYLYRLEYEETVKSGKIVIRN